MSSPFWIAVVALAVVAIVVRTWRARLRPEQAQAIHAGLEQGARLIDVRTPGEFSSGHLQGAINVPLDQLVARTRDLGPKKKPLVVYCHSGSRSGHAARLLRGLGYEQVLDLKAMANGRAVQREPRA